MRAKKKATKKRPVKRPVKKKAPKKQKKKMKLAWANWAKVVVKQQEELETLQDEVLALHNLVKRMNADQAAMEQDAAIAKGYLLGLYEVWLALFADTNVTWSEQRNREVRELVQKIGEYLKPNMIVGATMEEPREADVGERVVPDAEPL